MRIETSPRFERDIQEIRNAILRGRAEDAVERIAAAAAVHQISGISRVRDPAGLYYRVRVGDYRLGFELVGDDTAVLKRFLIRGRFYRHFP